MEPASTSPSYPANVSSSHPFSLPLPFSLIFALLVPFFVTALPVSGFKNFPPTTPGKGGNPKQPLFLHSTTKEPTKKTDSEAMECEGAPDVTATAQSAEYQTEKEIIDLVMTNVIDLAEGEIEEQARETRAANPIELPEKRTIEQQENKIEKERKHGGKLTERERNLAIAHKFIAAEKKQVETRGNALIWLAEKLPEICNQAISMAKGDAEVKKLTSHVSAEFRAMFAKIQHGNPTTGGEKNKPTDEAPKKQSKPNGKQTYASVAKQVSETQKQPAPPREKTGPKPPAREAEKKVRVFIRGPASNKEETVSAELAKIFKGTPKEFETKKVNSGWAFYIEKSKATTTNLERAKTACGARACELDSKWTHARITGLSDFYVLNEGGPVPTKNEEWFTGQIARQTGGQVKAIKWQIEAEKYKDATLRVAIDLPEGKTLPSAMKFEGSNNAAQVKRCRTPSLPLCRTCWEAHPTTGCKAPPRCRLCGSRNHQEKEHSGPPTACTVCNTAGHAAGEAACKRDARVRKSATGPETQVQGKRKDDGQGYKKRKRTATAESESEPETESEPAQPCQDAWAYNAPESRNCIRPGEGLQELMRSEKESAWIAIGDLNAHHGTWDANPRENEAGRTLESWMRDNDLTVLNDKDEHTHSAGRVIDLVITPQTTVGKWTTCMKLIPGSTSDHEIIEVKVRTRTTRKRPEAKWRLKKMNVDKFVATCNQEADQLEKLLEGSGDALDTAELLAKGLIATVERALEASTPKTPPNIVLKPWWNEGCKEQNARMRRARIDHRNQPTDSQKRDEYAKQRKAMRKEITKAKRALMSKIIAGLKEPKDVFRAVKWANDKVDRRIPCCRDPTRRKPPAQPKNEWCFHEPNPEASEWPSLTREEVRDSLWKPANTAPGADRITNEVWKRAWEPLGNMITKLYNLCLENGNHPSIFKEADLVAIPKPGRPRDEPRSYRLISLLPTLGKGMERAVARRLAEEAVQKRIIPRNYICAVPKRAVTDLLIELRGRIEDAQLWKKVTSILTFDIKGAFDAVEPARMERQLSESRWPTKLCRWVRSFMEGRTARMRTEEGWTTKRVGGSLPQGSPVSPILYMLFMAPIYRRIPNLLGYADDGALVVRGQSFEDNCQKIKSLMETVIEWTAQNGLDLDPGKSTLLHIKGRRRITENPSVTIEGMGEVKPTPAKEPMRWLGLHIDSSLLFKGHVERTAASINRVANGLRYLAGCYKGADTTCMLNAARACALSKALFASSTWMGTETTKTATEKVNVAIRNCLRAALPMYCTTPKECLHHAAGLPPIELLWEDERRREAIRWHTLDIDHTLRGGAHNPVVMRLRRLLPARMETHMTLKPTVAGPSMPPRKWLSKEKEAEKHREEVDMATVGTLIAYSDGSKDAKGNTGAGWVTTMDGTTLETGHSALGKWVEVADAEAYGACEAAKRAVMHTDAEEIWICLDNQGVVDRLRNPQKRNSTSQDIIDRTKRILNTWKNRKDRRRVQVLWVPGHVGLEGNEQADAQAKLGCLGHIREPRVSLAGAKRWRRNQLREEYEKWWKGQKGYRPLQDIPCSPPFRTPGYKGVDRTELGHILAARTGHGDFDQYHDRFNHQCPRKCIHCKQPKERGHMWTCKTLPRPWGQRFTDKLLKNTKATKYVASVLHRNLRHLQQR
ncbi:endonuclease/reverse transcriptase [Ceratocystis lukuohia]|uniref:Endonuclease/reverse transcriptase n=1 Tax=Ceratocystis lukuohia TaxID=2019550 RepID=A0ABR4MR15_9PEZI